MDRARQIFFGASILTATASFWGATQFEATRFAGQPELGSPLVRIFGASLYDPWKMVSWYRFAGNPEAIPILVVGTMMAGLGSLLSLMFLWAAFRGSAFGRKKPSTLHGSAHWASPGEIRKTGLLEGKGVYVGAVNSGGKVQYLRHDGPEHILAFAPTRSGKGVGLVLPTLLTWPHSVLVHDIKGENWALSAGWRKSELGSLCLKFEPTASDGSSVRFNPLAEIRIGTEHEVQDVMNIATMIVDPDGKGLNDHWAKTGFALLVGTILHVLYAEPDKTLRGVARFLSNPDVESDTRIFELMKSAVHDPEYKRGFRDRSGRNSATHPVVADSAQEMLNKADNERSGVISTAMSFLSLYRDDVVARNTEVSDFSLTDLMNDEKPVSLYLVVPPSDKERLKPLVRLVINQTVRRLTESMAFSGGKPVAGYRHRLLLMIDEFPALGRLDIFSESLAFIAGYGLKAYLITQDLSQLYAAYTRDESILSNCHVRIAYAPNKIETARLLSDMCGKSTVFRPTTSYSGGRFSWLLKSKTVGEQEFGRELLTPDEAMALPPDEALVFVAGHPPIRGRKIRYYEDREFSRRAKVEPPPVTDRIREISAGVFSNTSGERPEEEHPETSHERSEAGSGERNPENTQIPPDERTEEIVPVPEEWAQGSPDDSDATVWYEEREL